MPDSAADVARQYDVCGKKFRRGLRAGNFPWREGKEKTNWNPPDGSPEHRDMIQVAESMAAEMSGNELKRA